MIDGISSRCEPERIDRPIDVDALVDRRAGDLLGGQADALVDDLHADVAGAHGDLLGAVGVAVEAGLADEDLHRAAERLADAVDLVAQLGHVVGRRRGGGLADAGRARGRTPKTSRSACAHSPVVTPARAAAIVASMMFSSVCGDAAQLVQRGVDGVLVALRRATRSSASLASCLDVRVDGEDAAVLAGGQRRVLGLRGTC